MCGRESQAREALRRIELVMQQRLRLQLHPEKTRTVGLRKGKEGFVIPGVYDPQEAQDSAESAVSFHASLAVSQGDESTPGPSPGDDECAEQRGRCEADYRQAESRSSRLGELLPNGHELTGVSKDGPIRVFATGALVKSARRATRRGIWTGKQFWAMGLHRLRGTVRYPAQAAPGRSSLSRVRENRTHGLKGVC
jgi:hypothetical protein